MQRILNNLFIVVFGLVVGLLLGEGLARVMYRGPWYEQLAAEQLGGDWTAGVWSNSLGLRDREYATPKPPNTRRVLFLGDSFTYGSGVADNNAMFARLIEKRLAAEFAPRGITIEVLNGGIAGSLTTDWVELLQKVKRTFQPDVIVVVFFLRDGTRTSAQNSFFEPIRDQIVAQNQQSTLYQNIYLYRWFKDFQDRALISTTFTQAIIDAYFGTPIQQQEWRTAQFNIKQIKAIGEEVNARVGVAAFPILAELNARYPFTAVCDLVVQFSKDNDLPAHNLLPAYIGQNAPDLWVSPANQHPNAQGHAIAADSLYPFVRQLLLDTLK
ncbi:MAG: hypothetical protein HZB53_20935 [Chloroflexi bacterium]|nr:hypothetical protein [Chloroflexota bacterium]